MSSSPSPKTKTKRRILVVDEESDITLTLKKGLENSGMFEVDTFNDPQEGRLDSKLQFSKQINLFSLAHNGFLSSSHYQTNPHELTQLLRLILRTL